MSRVEPMPVDDEWIWVPPGTVAKPESGHERGIAGVRRDSKNFKILIDTGSLLVYEILWQHPHRGKPFFYVHRSLLSPER